MKKIIIAIVFLLGLSASANAQPAQQPRVPTLATVSDMICMGVPANRCRTYQNMISPGLTVVALVLNGQPQQIWPVGGYLPLPKLVYRQITPLVFRGCSQPGYDVSGNEYCRFTLVAVAFETVRLPFQVTDPKMKELMTTINPDPAYMHCYETQIDVYEYWDKQPVSHHVQFNKVQCPANIYPRNVAAAALAAHP